MRPPHLCWRAQLSAENYNSCLADDNIKLLSILDRQAAALPSLQSIPELVRVRRQASGLMSMPDDTSGAAKLSRLGRILNVTDVRIAVRGPCRPRRFHPPSACEFSRDFISLPVLKKGTALLPTESPRAGISSGSACPDPYKKYPKPPQFDPITARHCGGNL
jgi:hypothetical protein